MNKQDQKQHLYRHYDSNGVLLYIGVSLSAVDRLRDHKAASHWFDQIASVTIEPFESRAAVLAAEKAAIQKEKPLHNVAHTRQAEATRRLSRAEDSRLQLLGKIVNFKPIYTPKEAGEVTGFGTTRINRFMESGQLGFINIADIGAKNPKLAITGWQLIDLIENLQGKPR